MINSYGGDRTRAVGGRLTPRARGGPGRGGRAAGPFPAGAPGPASMSGGRAPGRAGVGRGPRGRPHPSPGVRGRMRRLSARSHHGDGGAPRLPGARPSGPGDQPARAPRARPLGRRQGAVLLPAALPAPGSLQSRSRRRQPLLPPSRGTDLRPPPGMADAARKGERPPRPDRAEPRPPRRPRPGAPSPARTAHTPHARAHGPAVLSVPAFSSPRPSQRTLEAGACGRRPPLGRGTSWRLPHAADPPARPLARAPANGRPGARLSPPPAPLLLGRQ